MSGLSHLGILRSRWSEFPPHFAKLASKQAPEASGRFIPASLPGSYRDLVAQLAGSTHTETGEHREARTLYDAHVLKSVNPPSIPGILAAHSPNHSDGKPRRKAGVALIVSPWSPESHEPTVTFISRSAHGPHAGQIGLPGGMMEEPDSSLLETALREVEEEIGIGAAQLNLLGAMAPRVVSSGSFVQPYLFALEAPWDVNMVKQPGEIESISRVPIAHLRATYDPYGICYEPMSGYSLVSPTFRPTIMTSDLPSSPLTIWGFTGRVIEDFLVALGVIPSLQHHCVMKQSVAKAPSTSRE